ncbi:LLM class flavin-dependent oxidoreductase [Microbacterium sp. GXS0129]|uniref:LLM class flavin-dependent oxidoreductase n=1 Tax=Microbacterium sp. GXS0129 TaxID=3377836 RepID=UPI00383BCEC0
MTDYKHDLLFGTFPTPYADFPEVLRLARAAERAGFDMVSIQDHPYNTEFFDTLTLIGQLVARTEKIRFAGGVLNLPLRPPAVLAKSIATLDVISGGRIELGLGAGGFWDAIVAYGGDRLTPGESLKALSEGIDIIRALWDVNDRSRVRIEGEHYHLVGARRGPAPAHPVSIWVGGYKPRMLRLIGSKADGWWPSLGRTPLSEIPTMNDAIDSAAVAAGRDPKDVRRLANLTGQLQRSPTDYLLQGPPTQWVEHLTWLAIEHGFSAFILAGDDSTNYELIGNEIIPAVREAVAKVRGADANSA